MNLLILFGDQNTKQCAFECKPLKLFFTDKKFKILKLALWKACCSLIDTEELNVVFKLELAAQID